MASRSAMKSRHLSRATCRVHLRFAPERRFHPYGLWRLEPIERDET